MNNDIPLQKELVNPTPFLVRKKRVLTEEQILKRIRKRATYYAFKNMGDELIQNGVPIMSVEPTLQLIHRLFNRWNKYRYNRTAKYAEESLIQYIKDITKYN